MRWPSVVTAAVCHIPHATLKHARFFPISTCRARASRRERARDQSKEIETHKVHTSKHTRSRGAKHTRQRNNLLHTSIAHTLTPRCNHPASPLPANPANPTLRPQVSKRSSAENNNSNKKNRCFWGVLTLVGTTQSSRTPCPSCPAEPTPHV
eukprot:438979-Rhodomonas_salina.1